MSEPVQTEVRPVDGWTRPDRRTRPLAELGAFGTEVAVLVQRRLRHVVGAPGRLVGAVMNPVVTLLAVGYLFVGAIRVPGADGHYIDYLLAGVAIQGALATMGPTAVSVRLDVDKGLMDRFRSLPIHRGAVLVAHSLADLVIGLGALLCVCAVGLLLGWRPRTDALHVLAGFGVLALFTYVVVWAGIACGLAMRHAESIDAVTALIMVVLTFVSNAVISPASLPGWIAPLAQWNPVSAVATVVRDWWGNPTGAGGPATDPATAAAPVLVVVLAVVVITAAAGFAQRRFAGRRAR